MPLPGTPHCAKVGILFTVGSEGNQCENTLYIQDSTDAMFVDPVLTCNLIQTAANANLLPGLSNQIGLTGVSFEDVRTFPFGGIEVGQASHVGTGPSAGDSLPSMVALAIKKSTANLGRSARGRWYWPVGTTGNLATADTIKSTSITLWVDQLAAFQASLELALTPAKMGIVSYRTGGVQRAAGLFQQIVNWSVTDSTVDSQRRRLLGRGR